MTEELFRLLVASFMTCVWIPYFLHKWAECRASGQRISTWLAGVGLVMQFVWYVILACKLSLYFNP